MKGLVGRIVIITLFCFCKIISTEDGALELGIYEKENTSTTAESENVTVSLAEININDNETTQDTKENKTQKFVQCLPKMGNQLVQLTNDTELIKLLQPDPKVTDRDNPGLCVLVLFYSKFCPFSSMAAPHYNALPRAFPDIKMVAINAMMYHLFNTQNGIVGVPSLMLFHGGRPVGKFNESDYTLDQFSKFITKYTGIVAVENSAVTSSDFTGPVISSPFKDFDMLLVICWLFIIVCSGYYFTKSKWWRWIIDTVQSNWRESEAHAHHEHVD